MKDFDPHTMARIHSVETCGTVDGPGIRFVVFMQGCHLRCKYCHNRDAWDSCGGKIVSIDELIAQILRYRNYFQVSGGGVTISGGEPLLQIPFLISLFQCLKKEKIHTTIDTSGILSITNELEELISLTDLFLLDIKHINEEKCKELIGCSNQKELAFATYLSEHQKPMWIRQVLIPGITDNKKDLLALKDFLSTLKTIEKIEILPYHDMGKFKWQELGIPYELEKIEPPTVEEVNRAKQLLGIQ